MIRHAVVDLDGTVYKGVEPVPGAKDAVAALRDQEISVIFLTNNATSSRTEYSEKLETLGIPAEPTDVVTSGTVTTDYLAAEHPDRTWFVVGEEPFRAMLRDRDVTLTTTPERAEGVVVALDREFDYRTLTGVVRAFADSDPLYVATNPDRTRPGERHPVPSTGSLIGAVEGATGRRPDKILGKPSPTAADVLQEAHAIDFERAILVGDRLETDIRFGKALGMETALVLSGVTDEETARTAEDPPDHVLESIAAVPAAVDERS